MEDIEIFAKAADNIRDNLHNVNKLLEDCEIASEVADQENKIASFLLLDIDQLIEDKPKDNFYDLDQISKILEMLETSKPEGKKKLRHMRSESSSSLLSMTSSHSLGPSNEDIAQNQDYINEVSSLVGWIRSTLKTICNSTIEPPDLNSVKDKESSRMLNFSENMMNLQKLAKELHKIASTDKTNDDQKEFHIDKELVDDLKQLSQFLADINDSSTNPLAHLPKQDLCSFDLTRAINDILNAIEQNYK